MIWIFPLWISVRCQYDVIRGALVVAVVLIELLLLHHTQLVLYEFGAIALQRIGPDQVQLLLFLLRRQAHLRLLVRRTVGGAHRWSLGAREDRGRGRDVVASLTQVQPAVAHLMLAAHVLLRWRWIAFVVAVVVVRLAVREAHILYLDVLQGEQLLPACWRRWLLHLYGAHILTLLRCLVRLQGLGDGLRLAHEVGLLRGWTALHLSTILVDQCELLLGRRRHAVPSHLRH